MVSLNRPSNYLFNLLLQFYKLSPNGLASLFRRQRKFFQFFLASVLRSVIISPTRQRKAFMKGLVSEPSPSFETSPSPKPFLGLEPTLIILPPNALFEEFIWTCINRVWDQAPTIKTKEEVSDTPLKVQNSDLYYGISHMECY